MEEPLTSTTPSTMMNTLNTLLMTETYTTLLTLTVSEMYGLFILKSTPQRLMKSKVTTTSPTLQVMKIMLTYLTMSMTINTMILYATSP